MISTTIPTHLKASFYIREFLRCTLFIVSYTYTLSNRHLRNTIVLILLLNHTVPPSSFIIFSISCLFIYIVFEGYILLLYRNNIDIAININIVSNPGDFSTVRVGVASTIEVDSGTDVAFGVIE